MNRMIYFTKIFGFIVLISLTSGTVQAVKFWQPLGPSPIFGGQSEIDVNNPQKDSPQVGAINALAPHPTNANILYVATVAGGIWKTENAQAAEPTWIPISDEFVVGVNGVGENIYQESLSLSTSDISFDLADTADSSIYSNLVASFGRYSSFNRQGGKRAGVMSSVNDGLVWSMKPGTIAGSVNMEGKNINSINKYQNVILASVDDADLNQCGQLGVFASYSYGDYWFQMGVNGLGIGMIQGKATALAADPINFGTYYVGIQAVGVCIGSQSGIYKTTDYGQNWTIINNSTMNTLLNLPGCALKNDYVISVGKQNNVYAGIICDTDVNDGFNIGRLSGVFRSGDGGTNWTEMDLPGTFENSGFHGLHPGGQGFNHRSMVADPIDPNIVYMGGDRQPDGFNIDGSGSQFPNSTGANTYSGRIFRGNASLSSDSQWSVLTHNKTANNTAPHADSRDLEFDAAGTLLEVDDGGIYRMLAPRTNTSDWISVNGNIQNSEIHSSEYDSNTKTAIAGLQDNGTAGQPILAEKKWNSIRGGDGGDVAVDDKSLAAQNQSIRYVSAQNLSNLQRRTYNENNQQISNIRVNRTVINGGAEFKPLFLTPIALNNLNPLRMIIGGSNSVYESLDQGDTISEIGVGIKMRIFNGQGTKNIAYGSNSNEDILYVAGVISGVSNGVFVRTTANGPLTHKYTPTSGYVNSIVVNEVNATVAYLVEDTRVLRTFNSGDIWNDITGNLLTFNNNNIGKIRTIEFIDGSGFFALIVGTDKGTFISKSTTGYVVWEEFGENLPPVPVWSLEYNKQDDVLVAGTMGRGEYIIKAPLSINDAPFIIDSPQVNPSGLTMNLLKGSTSSSLTDGSISLLDSFSDASGQTLTVQTTPVKQPSNGLVTLNTNGTFSYQHDDSMTNTDEFYYRVCDDGIPVLCNDAKVNVTIDFGTNALVCSSPNVDIFDNTIVTDTITMMQAGLITDLEVGLEINHTYVGDLTIKLIHASGREIFLKNRLGNESCVQNNISAILDDDELLIVDTQCDSPMAINGRFKPSEALSSFNNLELSGNWNIEVTDSVTGDEGALISWCLDPKFTSSPPVLDFIANKSVNETENLNFIVTATDLDTNQANLVFSLGASSPTGASISADGNFSFTPTESQGGDLYNIFKNYTFDVIVSDDSVPPETDSQSITVTVNEVNTAPILSLIGNQSVTVLKTLSFTAMAVDTDFPVHNLSFSLGGTAPINASINPTSGYFTFTPMISQVNNSYTFDVIVSDDQFPAMNDFDSITVTVNDVIDDMFKSGFE